MEANCSDRCRRETYRHTPEQQVAVYASLKQAGIHQSQEAQVVGMNYFDCFAFVSSMLSNQRPRKRDTAKIRLSEALL